MSNTLPFSKKSVTDQLELYCCVSSQNLLLFVLLLDAVFLSVVVILLLVEMLCFYVHISTGSSMILFVAMLVLTVTTFSIISIVLLRMVTGLLLSFWQRFFYLSIFNSFRVI